MSVIIKSGIEVLDFDTIGRYRIGLITNYSSVNWKDVQLMALLAEKGIIVIRLFASGHGLCVNSDSKEMTNFIHPKQCVPAYNIYGKRYLLGICHLPICDVSVHL